MMTRKRKTSRKHLRAKAGERGFALPLSIGVGISLLLLGSLMIARSNVDQVTAIAQVQSAGALSVAEAGVARTLSQLNSPSLAHLITLNYDPNRGGGGTNAYLGPDQILLSNDEPGAITDQWTPNCGGTIPASLIGDTVGTGANEGRYTVLAYRYNPNTQTGSLLVEGSFRGSTSRVQVSVSRRDKSAPVAFPGVYGSDSVVLLGNDVLKVSTETGRSANVICGGCTVPSTTSSSCVISATATAGIITTKAAMGGNSQSDVDGQSIIAQLTLPTIPEPPPSGATGRYDIATINSSMTLPRPAISPAPADQADANGVYHYVINEINLQGGGKTLTISPPSGKSVRLYVSGDITISGNAAFAHSNTPDRFAIFGGTSPQNITLNGGTTASKVFIYAPNAAVKINGGGAPGTNNIYGAVWAKTWRTNGSNIDIQVPDNMPDLLRTTFGSTFTAGARSNAPSAPTNWSREGRVR
jgi:hypothetical protein